MNTKITQTNTKCDVLFISPIQRAKWVYLPFAYLCLSSYLEQNGITNEIIDLKKGKYETETQLQQRYYKTILSAIDKYKPSMIALAAYTSEYSLVMESAKIIRDKYHVPIIVGGVHATLNPKDFFTPSSAIDYVIMGEGETPLLNLATAIKNNTDAKTIESIAYRNGNEVVVNGGCNVELDLNKLPRPNYEKLDMSIYTYPNTGLIRMLPLSGVMILTSRGCPFNCDFCANNYLHPKDKNIPRVRFREVDAVIEEIELLYYKYHIDGFSVLDDCFMISKPRTIEFCNKLIDTGIKLVWEAQTRANYVTDESVLLLMKKAGLIQLEFGVETGSQKLLNVINKRQKVEQVINAFELCRKNGIRTYANILLNLPWETVEDIKETEKLLDTIRPSSFGVAITVPLYGTKIYEDHVNPKLTTDEYEIYNKNPYYQISDERFKMAQHNLNFTNILVDWGTKYSPFAGLSANPTYLYKIITSRYVFNYMWLFTTDGISKIFFMIFNEKNTPGLARVKRRLHIYINKLRG